MASHRTAVITNIGDQGHILVILDDVQDIPPEEWERIGRLLLGDGCARVPLKQWFYRDTPEASFRSLSEAYREWRTKHGSTKET